MPLYEYRCEACGGHYTVLVGMTATGDALGCPLCGADAGTRRITRFAVRTGDRKDIDIAGPESFGDTENPATLRRWARETENTLGEGLGDDFDEYIDAAEGGPENN